jgi:hypothetical protein
MFGLVACSAPAPGCAEPPPDRAETQEIIDDLVQAGFPAADILVADGVVGTSLGKRRRQDALRVAGFAPALRVLER